MATYQVNVHRDERWWMIHVPELDGVDGLDECIGQSRRLEDVDSDARDIIGLVADVAPSAITIDLHITVDGVDDDLADVAASIADQRQVARRAEEQAVSASRTVATKLKLAGVPVRDIATVTGVSFQRIQQLTGAGHSSHRE